MDSRGMDECFFIRSDRDDDDDEDAVGLSGRGGDFK